MLHAAAVLIPGRIETSMLPPAYGDTAVIPQRRKPNDHNGYRDTMNDTPCKTQLGVRLPTDVVEQIDAQRQNKTRAEYCRELIEAGVSTKHNPAATHVEAVSTLVTTIQDDVSEIRSSLLIAERNIELTVREIARLRQDMATAIVGVLTKIGQAVREEDQRPFARKKAEAFARQTLLANKQHTEEEA